MQLWGSFLTKKMTEDNLKRKLLDRMKAQKLSGFCKVIMMILCEQGTRLIYKGEFEKKPFKYIQIAK